MQAAQVKKDTQGGADAVVAPGRKTVEEGQAQ